MGHTIMEINLLACPSCGSTFFTSIRSGEKIVFRVNALYVPLGLEKDPDQDTGLHDISGIHCGACTWAGGIRELVPSHE